MKELGSALNKFAKYIVQQSRTNLTKGQNNASKGLYDSIGYTVKENPNSFSLAFIMNEYGTFQDKGVKGKDPSKVSKNAKIKGQQAPNSPYKFGSGTHKGTWGSFVSSLEGWVSKKRIRLRDDKGKFKKGSYKTIAYIIAGNIYNRGLKPSLFFTKPFEKSFKNLPQELVEAYALEVMDFMKFTTTK
jgi:hypothetical protein